jgi:acetyl/propionyl-CoA carboxylase alpha subunit
VRFDTHLVAGAEIGAFYDGLLGKLICSGTDREQARGRMLAAFDEFAILGVTNTAGFLRDAVASERALFRSAARRPGGKRCRADRRGTRYSGTGARRRKWRPHRIDSVAVGGARRVRAVETAVRLRAAEERGEREVEILEREGTHLRARIDGREVSAQFDALASGGGTLSIDGRRFRIASARRKDTILVAVGPRTFSFVRAEEGGRHRARGLAAAEITAPMPGKVLRVPVREGDAVVAGQTLVVLEAMKMETALAAESDAVVKRVLVAPGQMVDHGALLIELTPPAATPSTRESGSPAS